jgi:hypothetical protein
MLDWRRERALEETLQTIGEKLVKLDEKLDDRLDAFGKRFDEMKGKLTLVLDPPPRSGPALTNSDHDLE